MRTKEKTLNWLRGPKEKKKKRLNERRGVKKEKQNMAKRGEKKRNAIKESISYNSH